MKWQIIGFYRYFMTTEHFILYRFFRQRFAYRHGINFAKRDQPINPPSYKDSMCAYTSVLTYPPLLYRFFRCNLGSFRINFFRSARTAPTIQVFEKAFWQGFLLDMIHPPQSCFLGIVCAPLLYRFYRWCFATSERNILQKFESSYYIGF